jgi:hypothetical protein
MFKSFRSHGTKYGFLALFFAIAIGCSDEVREFNGFTQKELEFLLTGENGKIWLRTERMENDTEVEFDDCTSDNYLIFVAVANATGKPKPLIYGYNPTICDSLDFCTANPDFCQSNVMNCEQDPDLCELLDDGMLYIGTWYAKAPFVVNDRADTLILEINKKIESVQVTSITSTELEVFYKNRKGSNGETITESYVQFVPETP